MRHTYTQFTKNENHEKSFSMFICCPCRKKKKSSFMMKKNHPYAKTKRPIVPEIFLLSSLDTSNKTRRRKQKFFPSTNFIFIITIHILCSLHYAPPLTQRGMPMRNFLERWKWFYYQNTISKGYAMNWEPNHEIDWVSLCKTLTSHTHTQNTHVSLENWFIVIE